MWHGKVKHKIEIMTKLCNKNRRESTTARDNKVHRLYRETLDSLGELANVVSKTYIYEKIRERTGLSLRTISFILNHTKPTA